MSTRRHERMQEAPALCYATDERRDAVFRQKLCELRKPISAPEAISQLLRPMKAALPLPSTRWPRDPT